MEPIISIHNLENRFGSNRVHDKLSMDVNHGEILGIVGGSGSGKSVLLRSILGLHAPAGGEISVLGQAIHYRQAGPDRCWGVLFQTGALLSALTVQENIELPIAIHSDMSAETRSELALLKIRMTGLPVSAAEKYPSELSGGMIKRAALARALALEPRILFLDEPTAGLDPIAATEFDILVSYLHSSLDLTIVMITHDLDTLFGICDRIAVLVDGKVVIGSAAEVTQSDHPWIRRYFDDPRAMRARQAGEDNERPQ